MVSLIDKCLTGQDKFQNFLDVVKECNIQTGDDFVHFMAVIKEHCLDKGITDYKEIIKAIKKSPRNRRILFHLPSGFNSMTFFSSCSAMLST